ncbi:uncharacterized protein LOC135840398 isoform X2 [Planococcus citri]|uniref:uncharacterized protein LOC135840398 isoform X2 n=1 Tax=Planococcus citri TaxID=170843 RepID=UPI0031FA081D
MQTFTILNVLLILLTFISSSWGLKYSFTNDTEVVIFVNETLRMDCSSDEEVEWRVPSTSQASIKRISSNVSSILINQADKSDDGDYICGSKNNSDQFARIQIRVVGLKCSFVNDTEKLVMLKEKFEFSCSHPGGVECSIPFKSKASIKQVSIFEESITSDGAKLSDHGDYVCRSKTDRNVFAFVSLQIAAKYVNCIRCSPFIN